MLAALSLETDLAMGHPPEEAMQTCLLATGLARRIGLSEREVADVYWTALLMHVGCTAYAHEQAALFGGDEIAVNAVGSKTDAANPKEMLAFLLEVGKGRGLLQQARLFLMALTHGTQFGREVATATCEAAALTAERLGLPDTVQRGLGELFERWDGKGEPKKLRGDAIARALGLPDTEAVCLRHGGYLHDLGKVAVPNGIWEKPGPLTAAEWEQVRLHPYHSERILSRSPMLAPLVPMVGMHHEHLDGSGYYRQATARSIPMPARVLAAADHYQGMREARAYRPALASSDAADQFASEVEAGRLDAEAVDAVLSAAGHEGARPLRQGWPGDLTDREVDVLRLLARGLSNREVGRRLFISPKTVGHHIEHIYQKIDVSSRAAAAIFAMQHDLLGGPGEEWH